MPNPVTPSGELIERVVIEDATGNTASTDSLYTPATITSGTSLSPTIDLGANQRLARIAVPNGWTAANLTFQASTDGGTTFFNLYLATDAAGATQEYTIGVPVTTGCIILVPIADFASIRHIKVRSGTAGTPVNQGADRILTLVTRTVA